MKYVHMWLTAWAALVALPSMLPAQTSVIEDGDFDTGIAGSGWTYDGPPEGEMEWDPSVGLPSPGSLRLTAAPGVRGGYFAVSRCFLAPRGSRWSLRANVFQSEVPDGYNCGIVLAWYRQADCSDEPAGIFETQAANAGMWGVAELNLRPPHGVQAARGFLVIATQGGGECHFDNVRFEATNAGVFLVPAATPTTLVVLALAIAAAGLVLLRLQRW